MNMTAPQWEPRTADIESARITEFARFAEPRSGLTAPGYHALWQWSVDDPAAFWAALWDFFELGDRPDQVLADETMPGAKWFPGARVNYVELVKRNARTGRPAILYVAEGGVVTELSWAELLGRTAAFAECLRSLGVGPGDRVVGYLPNIPETISRRCWSPRTATGSVARSTTRPRTLPRCGPACRHSRRPSWCPGWAARGRVGWTGPT